MALLARPHHMPARLSAAAILLHSGADKLGADEQTAAGLHGFASGAYPFLQKLEPPTFVTWLARAEVALGAVLALPVVPTRLAAAALTGFSAGLLGLYLRTPGMRREGSLRPTSDGLTVAKDVWLLGIGGTLLLEPRDRA